MITARDYKYIQDVSSRFYSHSFVGSDLSSVCSVWIGLISCHEAWSVYFLTSTQLSVCVCGKSAARSLLNPDVLSLRVFTHTHAHCRVKSTGMLCSDLRFLQWGLCLSSALEMQIKLYYSNSGGGREGTDASGQHARTRSQCVCVKFIRWLQYFSRSGSCRWQTPFKPSHTHSPLLFDHDGALC